MKAGMLRAIVVAMVSTAAGATAQQIAPGIREGVQVAQPAEDAYADPALWRWLLEKRHAVK